MALLIEIEYTIFTVRAFGMTYMAFRKIQLLACLALSWILFLSGNSDASDPSLKSDSIAVSPSAQVQSGELTLFLENGLSVQITKEELVKYGMRIIFGSEDPQSTLDRGEGPIGKGQCPLYHQLCHQMLPLQKADRSIPLIETTDKCPEEWNHELALEQRAHLRIQKKTVIKCFPRCMQKARKIAGSYRMQKKGENILSSLYIAPTATFRIAKTGMIGSLPIMKSSAENRIRSPEYQQAVRDGKAHAVTPKEM